ncbi:MAG: TRAP transporter large permease subunit [Spirochaetales bacterium]|nr:TRAP transporter large permease subunit [Spirochaetales bacterium]
MGFFERFSIRFKKVELGTATIAYGILVLIPTLDAGYRLFSTGSIPGLSAHVPHLMLLITALAAMISSANSSHLSMGLDIHKINLTTRRTLGSIKAFFETLVTTTFFIGTVSYIYVAILPDEMGGIFPKQFYSWFLALAFLVILIRWFGAFVSRAEFTFGLLGIVFGLSISLPGITNLLFAWNVEIGDAYFAFTDLWYTFVPPLMPYFAIGLVGAVILGIPIFVVLGGLAVLLFAKDGIGPEIIPLEGVSMLQGSAIPAIALFTLAGYILSGSKAGKRLVLVFKSSVGWIPGGMVLSAVIVSTFFTTFTGASGVTILALGGLLHVILQRSGRLSSETSIGIITSSSSIGLLFPPSLAIILYGSISQIPINTLFFAGLGPGLLFILGMGGYGLYYSIVHKVPLDKFNLRRMKFSLGAGVWELLVPVLIVALYFSGIATLVETSALTVVYTILVEVIIRKELDAKGLLKAIENSLGIVGGVLIILMVARGLSSYIVDAGIPQSLTAWVTASVTSPLVFLLLLNVALLVVGSLMDLFSALFVVVPLILPLGLEFGIDPIHLAMIFLSNLGLGFITPPVGMNLFLSSYRFNQPLGKVYKSVLPFLGLQLIIVFLITYIPALSTLFIPKGM